MMYNIPLPRVIGSSGAEIRRVQVSDATVNLNIMPLSTATLTLAPGEELSIRQWVEMFTSRGSVGIFRVRAPGQSYGQNNRSIQLDHGIVEVGDYIIKTELDINGAADTAISTIWQGYGGSKWQLGTVAPTERVTYSGDHTNVLTALIDVMGQLPEYMMAFDFTTTPWTLNIVERPVAIAGEGRLSRNVVSAKITQDDSSLCTKLHWTKEVEGQSGHSVASGYVDADTQNLYGVVEQFQTQPEGMTDAEFLADCNKYLERHKHPLTTVSLELQDLQAVTGEALDGFAIGNLYRLVIPEDNITFAQTLVTLNWRSVYRNPGLVTATLANAELSVFGVYNNTQSGGGSASSAAKTSKAQKSASAASHDHVKTVQAGKILHQAGLEWDENHALLFAKDEAGDLGKMYGKVEVTAGKVSLVATDEEFATMAREGKRITGKIDVEAGRITQIVTAVGANGEVTSASIITAINNDTHKSEITLNADQIFMNGDTIVTKITGVEAQISNIKNGSTICNQLRTQSLNLDGYYHHNSNITIGNVTYNIVTWGSNY